MSNENNSSEKETKTNYEVMNEQISQLADLMKGMFTEEQLKDMEKRYDELLKSRADES